MSYINATTEVKVYINGIDVSQYLIQGSISEDSAYSSNIITCTGQIVLGGTTEVLDFNRTKYKIGSAVDIWCKLDNGEIAKHPKGRQYIINSSTNFENRSLTLDIGCSLAFISEREEQYQDSVQNLWDLMSSTDLKSFLVEETTLSTLSQYLDCVGKVIFQDKYGYIQIVNAFGGGGVGNYAATPKLTSFDTHTAISIESISETAIEPEVDSVTVEVEIDVPTLKEDDDDSTSGDLPEPLISSVTTRTVQAPRPSGNIDFGTGPTILTSQSNPKVATGQNWDGTIGHNYQVTGQIEVEDFPVVETVTSGKYIEYNGPGNQVSFEQNWEHSSAATWASGAIRNTLTELVTEINKVVEEINGLLQKANQAFDKRDEYNEGEENYDKWHEISSGYYNTARDYFSAVESMVEAVNSIANQSIEAYNIATLTETYYEYGSAGEVTSQITLNYVPTLARENKKTHKITKSWTTSSANGTQEQINVGFYIQWEDLELIEDRDVPNGKIEIGDFMFEYPVDLINQSTKTYFYGHRWTTERDEYVDYENPENNYVSENYSSTESSAPSQPDRIEIPIAGGESLYTDESSIDTGRNNSSSSSSDPNNIGADSDPDDVCNEETESVDKSVTIELRSPNVSPIATTWFGDPNNYEKIVSMPLEFQPLLLKKNSQGECVDTDFSSDLNTYETYIRRYAYVVAQKIHGDNRGFRITEKMRAEVFGYHPFYPVKINLSSASIAFNTRAAASSWVFDGSNALCSFDCLVYSSTELSTLPSPSTSNVHIKTETTKVFTITDLAIPSTASSITIKTLPSDGTLQLNGANVSVNDVISVSDINSGNLTFVPSSSGTTDIDFTYESNRSDNVLISSIENVYPVDTAVAATSANYKADAGDFDNNTTNGGTAAGGGDFDAQTSAGGFSVVEAGDFDTGNTVLLPQPPLPASASGANGDTDYEANVGVAVKDENDNQIQIDTLPTGLGEIESGFDVIVNGDFVLTVQCILKASVVQTEGFDYGYCRNTFGYEIDFGTITNPDTFNGNFGTVETPVTPAIASSVT